MHSLAIAVIVGTVFMFSWAEAQETWLVNGKKDTKVGAVKALLADKDARVEKCVPQELTEKLTLRGVKKK